MSRALSFGPFLFDTTALALSRAGEDIAIPPRAAEVLRCLLERPGKVVLKDDLLEAAWPDSFVSEDSLTQAISVIRQCLGDDARSPRYVQTVPKRGYRFVAEVRVADWPTPLVGVSDTAAETVGAPLPEPPSGELAPPLSGKAAPSSVPAVVLALGAAAALILVLALLPWQRPESGEPSSESASGGFRIRSLGVAEFSTADDASQAVAAAVREATIDAIRRQTEFTVVRTDEEEAPVDAVLMGRMSAADGRLLVDVRIESPGIEREWWRQGWDLPQSGFVAEEFGNSLVSRARFLFDLTSAYSTLRGSADPDAVRLVVRASELLLGPAMLDLRVAAEAADELRRATELDPHFARARAGRIAVLAESIYWRPWSDQEHATAVEELDRAEQDDPGDPVVFVARALLALIHDQPEAMRAAIDRAGELDPRLFWVYMIRADLERHAGLYDAALATIRRGLALDPYLPALHDRLIEVHLDAGDLDSARVAAAALVELAPDSYYSERAMARVLWRGGDREAAAARLASLRERFGDSPWVYRLLHDVYRETGQAELADRMAETYRALQR